VLRIEKTSEIIISFSSRYFLSNPYKTNFFIYNFFSFLSNFFKTNILGNCQSISSIYLSDLVVRGRLKNSAENTELLKRISSA
jgi:hypothetical protein